MVRGFSAEGLNKKETAKTKISEQSLIWEAYQQAKKAYQQVKEDGGSDIKSSSNNEFNRPYNEFIELITPLLKRRIIWSFREEYKWKNFSENDVNEVLSNIFRNLASPRTKEKLFAEDVDEFNSLNKFFYMSVLYGVRNFFNKKKRTEKRETPAGLLKAKERVNIEEEIEKVEVKELLLQALKAVLARFKYKRRNVEIFFDFVSGKTTKEIAKEKGIAHQRVSQILLIIKRKIGRALKSILPKIETLGKEEDRKEKLEDLRLLEPFVDLKQELLRWIEKEKLS